MLTIWITRNLRVLKRFELAPNVQLTHASGEMLVAGTEITVEDPVDFLYVKETLPALRFFHHGHERFILLRDVAVFKYEPARAESETIH